MKEEIEDLKETILRIALEKPYTRGCYWRLYFEYLLDQELAFTSKKQGYFVPYKHLEDLPSPESVSRTYRKLCEEHTEIKPDEKVQEYRMMNEMEMDHINEWWEPVRDGVHPKQTVLFSDEGGDTPISCGTIGGIPP